MIIKPAISQSKGERQVEGGRGGKKGETTKGRRGSPFLLQIYAKQLVYYILSEKKSVVLRIFVNHKHVKVKHSKVKHSKDFHVYVQMAAGCNKLCN